MKKARVIDKKKSPGYPSIEKATWFMGFAEHAATRSPDPHCKVGAALVQNGSVVMTGFNGFARGAKDHKLPTSKAEKHPYMIHAEMNLIAQCAKHGIRMVGGEVYCTLSPCVTCMRLLWQAGIDRVYVNELHKTISDNEKMLDLHTRISFLGHLYVLEYMPYA